MNGSDRDKGRDFGYAMYSPVGVIVPRVDVGRVEELGREIQVWTYRGGFRNEILK